MYPDDHRLAMAVNIMSVGHHGVRNNKRYGWIRKRFYAAMNDPIVKSRMFKKRMETVQSTEFRNNQSVKALKSWDQNPQRKTDLGERSSDLWRTESYRNKTTSRIAFTISGKYLDKEYKERVHEGIRNKAKEIITCPHCGKEGKYQGMKSWHFNNCYIVNPGANKKRINKIILNGTKSRFCKGHIPHNKGILV